MLGRIDCEKCGGFGQRRVPTIEGPVAEVDCYECDGFGGFPIYGPPTREQAAEIEAQQAASEANAAKWATFACTHCDYYCDAWIERGPTLCYSCDEGIVVPLRDLQAAARGALPWRRRGEKVIAIEPPDPRQSDLFDGVGRIARSIGLSDGSTVHHVARRVSELAADSRALQAHRCRIDAYFTTVLECIARVSTDPVTRRIAARAVTRGQHQAMRGAARAAIEVRNAGDVLDEVVATGASFHLECMSEFNPFEDEPACWWMAIEVGSEVVHVTLSAESPISAVVERWTEPPKEPTPCR